MLWNTGDHQTTSSSRLMTSSRSGDCAPGVVELYGFEVATEGAFRTNSLLWHARSLARGDLVGNRRRGEFNVPEIAWCYMSKIPDSLHKPIIGLVGMDRSQQETFKDFADSSRI